MPSIDICNEWDILEEFVGVAIFGHLVNEITIQVVVSMLNKLMIVAKDKFLFSISWRLPIEKKQ